MPSSGSYLFPALTGRGVHFCGLAQPLTRIGNATCFVSSVIQAWVHTPNVANLAEKAWQKRCGCTQQNSPCWLCYIGLRVASSQGKRASGEGKVPLWVLQRLHLLFPKSSQPKRNAKTPKDPDQVKLSERHFSMFDCADFQTAYLDKARERDSDATEQGSISMVDHVFGSQLVQDLTCPGCRSSLTFQAYTAVTIPLMHYDGQVYTTTVIGRAVCQR